MDDLYREYWTRPQVFLAGFSAGGQFVQGFAFQYPRYVLAVSVIAPGNVYLPTDQASRAPFLVIVGDRDDPLAFRVRKSWRHGWSFKGIRSYLNYLSHQALK